MTHDHHHAAAETAIDPVCEMVVDPKTARSADVRGKTYYFCSEGCRTKFVADPDKYLNRTPFVLPPRRPAPAPEAATHDHAHHDHPAPVAPAPAGTKYTCPMHPEIVADGPG